MGFWVTHPKDRHPLIEPVDRDFCFLLNAYDIDPGSYTPKVNTMLDFNLWTWNSRSFPGIDSLNVRKGDKVRIRIGNLTMTNHPMHLHGHEFVVSGTDGGPTPIGSRWPEVTTDVAVGQMRQIDFLADEEGDWAFHCHKSHHTMNAMGHDVPTMIGVDHRDVVKKITDLIPDYMVMGERGMADMGRDGNAHPRQHPADDDRPGDRMGPSKWAACFLYSKSVATRNRATTAILDGTNNPRAHKLTNGPGRLLPQPAATMPVRAPCVRPKSRNRRKSWSGNLSATVNTEITPKLKEIHHEQNASGRLGSRWTGRRDRRGRRHGRHRRCRGRYPHSSFTYQALTFARERAIASRTGDIQVPTDLADPERVRRGAGNYAAMCVNCHLSPEAPDSEIRKGLYPTPPNLSEKPTSPSFT
jgi:hypothetical protein